MDRAAGGEANLIAPDGDSANTHSPRLDAHRRVQRRTRSRFDAWDGTDQKNHVRVTATPPPGGQGQQGAPALFVEMGPSGERVLAQVSNDLYIVTVPVVGGTEPTIQVGNPENANFPVRRLTDIGGQFPAWSADGKRVHWSIGNAHVVYDLDRARGFDDSVRTAQRAHRRPAATAARGGPRRTEQTSRGGAHPLSAARHTKGSVVLRVPSFTMRARVSRTPLVVRDNRASPSSARSFTVLTTPRH